MANQTILTISTEQFPEGKLTWEVEFPPPMEGLEVESIALQFAYNNALNDLCAAVTAKLGIEMSKTILSIMDESTVNDECIECLRKTLDTTLSDIKVSWDL